MARDGWSERRDLEHPVLWTSANDQAHAYLTLDEAVRRLAGYGWSAEVARSGLVAHQRMRTPYAFYEIEDGVEADSEG